MDDILGIPSDDHQISTLQHLCRILLDEFKVFKVESNQIKDDVYRVQRLDRIHFERLVDQMKDAGVERQEMREEMKTRVEEMEVREGVLVKEMKRMEEELAGWKKRVTELEMGRDGERRSDVRGRSVGERGRERQVSRGRQHQRRTVSPMTWDVSIESAEETVRTSPVGVTVTTQPSKATLMSSPKKRGREEDDDEPVSKKNQKSIETASVEERGRGRSVKGKGARGTFVESVDVYRRMEGGRRASRGTSHAEEVKFEGKRRMKPHEADLVRPLMKSLRIIRSESVSPSCPLDAGTLARQ
ncbi:hypothetical protein BC829DRAFT_421015 [Chytridium lagenaria]|nr:hypothetical protein BC829DRAFT_421015 [Chytridium lagenaria]